LGNADCLKSKAGRPVKGSLGFFYWCFYILKNGAASFRIQISGERIQIPAKALFHIEHEREGNKEEVEFEFKWER